MDIDPTLTPREVAEQYKKLRAKLIGTRYRSMTQKHLRLAEFYGGNKPEGTTWATLMDEWNHSQKKGWRYTDLRPLPETVSRLGTDLWAVTY